MSRPTASSWMNLNCGDTVCTVDDPRHVGRLEAIENSAVCKIRWYDNGFLSYVPLHEVRRVNKAIDCIADLDVVTTATHSFDDATRLVKLLSKRNILALAMPIDGGYRVVLTD